MRGDLVEIEKREHLFFTPVAFYATLCATCALTDRRSLRRLPIELANRLKIRFVGGKPNIKPRFMSEKTLASDIKRTLSPLESCFRQALTLARCFAKERTSYMRKTVSAI